MLDRLSMPRILTGLRRRSSSSLFSSKASSQVSLDCRSDNLVVFYASQTGNAEWIAKSIDKAAVERGYVSRCFAMDDYAEVNDKLYLLECMLTLAYRST
jgi:sulfite reductase alpha subunit-like flavoprotein